MHYLPGFLPGSQNIFRPVRVAVPPPNGDYDSGSLDAGMIYNADGSPNTPLAVVDAPAKFHAALLRGLKDAGLAPIVLDTIPGDGKPPDGSDFILNSLLEKIQVNKRFAAGRTVHGQVFTMHAEMRVKYELKNRDGAVLYSGEVTGVEDEPPNPVDGEVFLPLETEPGESLSVALSRAVGSLMLQPKFREQLPMRSVEATPLSTPTGTPIRPKLSVP